VQVKNYDKCNGKWRILLEINDGLWYYFSRGAIKWFVENDWIPNKILVGEWETTDPRWTTYLEERAVKRARRDEILALLG